MRVIDRIDESLYHIEEVSLVICFVVGMFALFINVFLRSFFNFILAFPDELARYLMIYIIYIGMSMAYKKNKQLRLDLLINIFPRVERYFNVLSDVISFVAIVVIFICGFQYSKELFCSNEVSSVLEIPLYVLYGIAPLTAIFMGFRLIRSVIGNVQIERG